jgi:hypothetical protein
LLATQLDASHVLGLVSFDCHPGSPFFFSSETHVVITRLCLLLLTPHTLSLQKATPVPTTTLSLSPQKVTRSICMLRCPRRPVPFATASCARSEDRAQFLSSESRHCSRLAGTRATAKGASGRRPRCPPRCCRSRDAASDPPPRGRGRLVESPRQGGN